jgi:hypothetical protein
VNEHEPQPLDYASQGRQNRPLAARNITRPTGGRAAVRFAKFVGWIFVGAGAFALLTTALWQLHPGLGIAAGAAWFIFLPALGSMAAELRRRRAAIILTHLAQATSLNLPLPRMIDAARWSESKETGRRLRQLRDLLEDGASLESALPIATPGSPRAPSPSSPPASASAASPRPSPAPSTSTAPPSATTPRATSSRAGIRS